MKPIAVVEEFISSGKWNAVIAGWGLGRFETKEAADHCARDINQAHADGIKEAVAERDARIAELEKALSVCERAIKALLVMMDRGDRPSKLDEALTWTQNDNLAKSLGRNAVEEIRKALGKGE